MQQLSAEGGRSYGRAAPAMSDLPPKWSEAKDLDSGDTYFWNTDTNETSWDRPVAPPTAGPAPPPPPPRRREQMATSGDDPEQLLLNPPDPNLLCPICLKLFAQPVRTACGCARRLEPVPSTTHHCTTHQKHNPTRSTSPPQHNPLEANLTLPSGATVLTVRALWLHRHVFCGACLEDWLPQKSQCPECRTDVSGDTVRDRFAERLVSNLQGFCQFRSHGCLWVGKRGDMPVHLARECPCITVSCPNDNCGAEMLRRDLWQHLEICPAGMQVECPWGCGQRLDSPSMEMHKAECLMEPEKLVAAIQRLREENQRLTTRNTQLKREQPQAAASPQLKALKGCHHPDSQSACE